MATLIQDFTKQADLFYIITKRERFGSSKTEAYG